MKKRIAKIDRKTKETQIELVLNIDGEGVCNIKTGVGFLDHMLDLLAKHALFNLDITAHGDTQVDDHHTVEDIGICFGLGIKEALGNKKGIKRFSNACIPMQETLANVAIDISGRSALVYNANFHNEKIGNFDVELIQEFLESFTTNAGINLHINIPYGSNSHHMAEAIFKGVAKVLGEAVRLDERITDIPSTKGIL
ncbi:MAG: imidazoleglycerol-phosphate dehydratase HisB [Candidatus Kuenenia sp.]|nr:imidazoleglycerol-phosphate dehydratase HisB [Candidatus Kuenenia hertensis]